MYLDSIVAKQVCYRFNDHDRSISLPKELQKEGTLIMAQMSNYSNLGFNPKAHNQITVGDDVIRRHYQVLLGIANMDLSQEENVDISLKQTLLFFVLLAEALRFPELEKWLLNILAKKLEMSVPVSITKLFNSWGTLSKILHKGRENFSIGNITVELLKSNCKTYDDVCSILGIANKINLRKLEKKKKKKNRL
ncbi:hypothetical protein CFC21_082587 [Triticum aestivum]|uniref:rRNA N-glycosidase n=2 Tax=Triticum aestivum TaxID=4565 RepID=A0A9R1I6M5_WHEAT|nr:hypothetical protein CFC21_082587 [Triticum aestivum]